MTCKKTEPTISREKQIYKGFGSSDYALRSCSTTRNNVVAIADDFSNNINNSVSLLVCDHFQNISHTKPLINLSLIYKKGISNIFFTYSTKLFLSHKSIKRSVLCLTFVSPFGGGVL